MSGLIVPDVEDYNAPVGVEAVLAKQTDCLKLLLEARSMLGHLVSAREALLEAEREAKRRQAEEEAKKKGNLSVTEIQGILHSQPTQDEVDWVREIQSLKHEVTTEIRRNHALEQDLSKLDKRIGLLIRNRGEITFDAKKDKKHKKGRKGKRDEEEVPDFSADPKMIEQYQDLFYLLQTEARYMAALVYVVQPDQVQNFLDTVIITLYGDAFSPREEYLLLQLFQQSLRNELEVLPELSAFITAETVVPKMVTTYNKRRQGKEYLRTVLLPLLERVITKDDLDVQINPVTLYQKKIADEEIRTGQPSSKPRSVKEDVAMEDEEIAARYEANMDQLTEFCQMILDEVISSLNQLPYGLRWLCKALRDLCQEHFPDATQGEILKLVGYFVYYRFINIAIVSPDAFNLIDTKDIKPTIRVALVEMAKVLQNLFYFTRYEDKDKRFLWRLNDFNDANQERLLAFLADVCNVPDPEDKLEVNQYNEMVNRTRPVILISTYEICRVHEMLNQHLVRVAPNEDDSLRVVMGDLGAAPPKPKEEKDIQLWLSNRFEVAVEEESEHHKLYNQTKEQVLMVLRMVPIESSIQKLNLMDVLEGGIKYAAESKNKDLSLQINKILENIQTLEEASLLTKEDSYESMVHDIALEVANRATIREKQRKEVSRLRAALQKLTSHQAYIHEQMRDYNEYLQGARKMAYQQPTKRKRRRRKARTDTHRSSFKFSYKDLAKRGVIVDSDVPEFSRKACSFVIESDEYGVFSVEARMAGLPVETMVLELDDLLERRYNNIETLKLEQVTLGVNMTLYLINEYFLKGKK